MWASLLFMHINTTTLRFLFDNVIQPGRKMGMAIACHNIITQTLNLEANTADSHHFNSSVSTRLLSAYFFVAGLSKRLNGWR